MCWISKRKKVYNILYYVEAIFCTDKISGFYFEKYISYNENIDDLENRLILFSPGHGGAESYFENIVPYLNKRKLVIYNNLLTHLRDLNFWNILNKISFIDAACFFAKILNVLNVGLFDF